MIFDETYRPFFETVCREQLYDRRFGVCEVELAAVASRTGRRAEAYRAGRRRACGRFAEFRRTGRDRHSCCETNSISSASPRPTIGILPPPRPRPGGRQARADREAVGAVARSSSTNCRTLARQHSVLAKVVYHKLFDPDHKKLRTLVADGQLQHVNNGYCTLLEPKQISGAQFAEWITGGIPGTLRGRALHQADRLHVRRHGCKSVSVHRPARDRRPGRRPHLGFRRSCGWSTSTTTGAKRPSISTPAG